MCGPSHFRGAGGPDIPAGELMPPAVEGPGRAVANAATDGVRTLPATRVQHHVEADRYTG